MYIDWEHEVDHRYAQKLGVPVSDTSKFLLIQPDTLEAGLRYIFTMTEAGVDLIVIDSVGESCTEAFFEEQDDGPAPVGLNARLWSQYLPKIKSRISGSENNSNYRYFTASRSHWWYVLCRSKKDPTRW